METEYRKLEICSGSAVKTFLHKYQTLKPVRKALKIFLPRCFPGTRKSLELIEGGGSNTEEKADRADILLEVSRPIFFVPT